MTLTILALAFAGGACSPCLARDYWIAPPDCTACSTNWQGNSPTNPLRFETDKIQGIIETNPLAQAGDFEVTLYFQPGQYVTRTLWLNGGTDRALILRAWDPSDPPVLRFQVPTNVVGFFCGPTKEIWLLQSPNGTNDAPLALARFEAHDLILDGNWPAWAATNTYANPANVGGFKLGGLFVKARQGHVSNLRVVNTGANGVTPWQWWQEAGTESFPLFFQAAEYQPNAWVIEDCEVRDFYSLHGGYCTAIMVTTPKAPSIQAPPADFRIADVRRCRVYGGNLEVALGTAYSTGVSFRDNVVVGVDRGFNCDSASDALGRMRNVDLTNNVFLDVNVLANIGGPGWNQDANHQWAFTNFVVSGNAARLRSVPLYQDYRGYQWQAVTLGGFTNWAPVSSAVLAPGRYSTGFCAGLLIKGTDQISFENNRFTTRPQAQFFEPDPAQTSQALWHPLWRPNYDPSTGMSCVQDGMVTVNNLRCSASSMDFKMTTVLADPLASLLALADLPADGFSPAGRIGWVALGYTGDGHLDTVWEVQVSQPEVVAGEARLKARVVEHRPDGDAAPWANLPLSVWVRSGPHAGTVASATWTNGLAYFSYPLTSGAQGADDVVVYWRYGSSGNPPGFDPWYSSWSVVEARLGQTVRFARSPDVADDRRLNPGTFRISRSDPAGDLDVWVEAVGAGVPRFATPGDAGDFRLYTNHITVPSSWYYLPPESDGRWKVRLPAGRSEATVRVMPRDNDSNRNVIEAEAACFRIAANAAYAVAPPGAWLMPGPTADSVAVTLWDGPKYRMYELSDVVGGGALAALSGAAHAEETNEALASPQEDSEVAGFEWPWQRPSRTQFDDKWLGESEVAAETPPGDLESGVDGAATAAAVPPPGSSDTLLYTQAYAINGNDSPGYSIGGYATYWNTYYQYYTQWGGRWQSPTYGDLTQAGLYTVFGLSDNNDLVGSAGGYACFVPSGSSTPLVLPALTSGQAGEALATDASGNRTVGWSKRNLDGVSVTRPTLWTRAGQTSWTVQDLGQLSPTNRPGYAFGANSAGIAVGKTQMTKSGTVCWRAFRWDGEMSELALPPDTSNITNLNNVANDVTAGEHAVGATDSVYVRNNVGKRETRACVWWAGAAEPALLGTVGWTGADAAKRPGRSEALGAVELSANSLVVVGTGWITPTGYSRAFQQSISRTDSSKPWSYGLLYDLNDSMWSLLPSGWTLVTAEDVNNQEWIVGLATDSSGRNRGYVLVPQAMAP